MMLYSSCWTHVKCVLFTVDIIAVYSMMLYSSCFIKTKYCKGKVTLERKFSFQTISSWKLTSFSLICISAMTLLGWFCCCYNHRSYYQYRQSCFLFFKSKQAWHKNIIRKVFWCKCSWLPWQRHPSGVEVLGWQTTAVYYAHTWGQENSKGGCIIFEGRIGRGLGREFGQFGFRGG